MAARRSAGELGGRLIAIKLPGRRERGIYHLSQLSSLPLSLELFTQGCFVISRAIAVDSPRSSALPF